MALYRVWFVCLKGVDKMHADGAVHVSLLLNHQKYSCRRPYQMRRSEKAECLQHDQGAKCDGRCLWPSSQSGAQYLHQTD